jgi:hypothetical protein
MLYLGCFTRSSSNTLVLNLNIYYLPASSLSAVDGGERAVMYDRINGEIPLIYWATEKYSVPQHGCGSDACL